MLLVPNKFHLLKIHHSEIAGVMQCMTEVEKVPKPRPEWLIFMFTNHCADWTRPQTSNQNILITPGRCKNLIWTGWDSRPTDDYIYVPSGIRYLRWRISANTQLRQVYTRAVHPSDLSLLSTISQRLCWSCEPAFPAWEFSFIHFYKYKELWIWWW